MAKKADYKEFEGKVAIITGADSGIGKAIALELSMRGVHVVINYHSDEAGANETLDEVKKNGSKGIIVKADVGDYADVQRMFKLTVDELGTPYIMINNAGVNSSKMFAADMDIATFDRCIKTNLYGVFYCTKEFVNLRKKEGGKGKIVNISSIHEDIAVPGGAEYCASKGGVRNFTRCLALELSELQININNIGPGMILTPMNQKAMDDPKVLKNAEQHIPLGRAGQPEEVAKLAAYLVSEDAAYATGQTYFLDGGLMINLGQGA